MYVVVYFRHNHGLCVNFRVERLSSPGSTEVVFSLVFQGFLVQIVDLDLVVVLVYLGILHDVLYPPFLGEQVELVTRGGVREVFSRYCEEELLLYVLHRYRLDAHVLMLRLGSGSVQVMVSGSMAPWMRAWLVRTLLQSTAPPSSRSSSLEKAKGLSLPNRMEICPEWDEMELPVHV